MKILFTGGGTGGHIFPLIAVSREIKIISNANDIPVELFYMGPDDIAKKWIENEGIKFYPVMSGKIRRYASAENILDMIKLPIGIISAIWRMLWIMPDAIFSKGGFGSIPVIIAGAFYRVPIIIHESDTIPGISNKFAAKFAKRIAISFSQSAKHFNDKKIALTGNPIRLTIIRGEKESAKKSLGLSEEKVILVVGGSQGAQKINDVILDSANQLLQKYQIIHVAGEKNFLIFKQTAEIFIKPELQPKFHAFPFLDEEKLKNAYAAADLIISRAGAGSIFEIAATTKPSIIIPIFSSANDHQRENAYSYARTGAAEVIEETNLTASILNSTISRILTSKEEIEKIISSAKSFAKLDAASKIAEEIIKLALRI